MPSLLENLRQTNCRLDFWLDAMSASREQPGVQQPGVATPEQMAGLLSLLLRAGAWLRAEPLPASGADPELTLELERYRGNVERLRDFLPALHRQLLLERTRLEAQRARVQSAAEWARASRQAV
jgi:hypothetical protein